MSQTYHSLPISFMLIENLLYTCTLKKGFEKVPEKHEGLDEGSQKSLIVKIFVS